jgi:hypothetical protein
MRRSLFILMALLVASLAVGFTTYRLTRRVCANHLARGMDDLDWLRLEFRLDAAQMARVRQLHEGYLPRCREFCGRIEVKRRAIAAVLDGGANLTAGVEQQLAEVAALRAQCQAAMLQHFVEVSRVMPPAQGRRYLAEMRRLTLGSHEQVEHSMSGNAPDAHGPR